MTRAVLRLVLDLVLTSAVALVLLILVQWFLGGRLDEALGEGPRVLFNFMDVGLALWLVLLIVFLVRLRPAGPSAGRSYLMLLVGAVVNLIVVLTVGFIQGGWAPLLVLFAIEAGLACLIAAAVVLPIVHRLVKSPEAAGPAT
jgi:hypothetical protein